MDNYLDIVKEYGLKISQPYCNTLHTDINISTISGNYDLITLDLDHKSIITYERVTRGLVIKNIELTESNLRTMIENLIEKKNALTKN